MRNFSLWRGQDAFCCHVPFLVVCFRLISPSWAFKKSNQPYLETSLASRDVARAFGFVQSNVRHPQFVLMALEPISPVATKDPSFLWASLRDTPLRIRLNPAATSGIKVDAYVKNQNKYDVELQSTQITATLYHDFNRIADALNVSIGDVLFAIFCLLLYRYTDDEQIVLGVRRHDALYPVVCVIERELTFSKLVYYCHKIVASTLSCESLLGLQKLARELGVTISGAYQPLLQVTFMLLEDDMQPSMPIETPADQPPFDLQVVARHSKQQNVITVDFLHRLDVLPPARAKRMAAHFLSLAQAAIQSVVSPQSTTPLSILELPLLSETEVSSILHAPNTTMSIFEHWDHSIIYAFYRQCQSRPDAAAVQFEDSSLSYFQLAALVSQYFSALQAVLVSAPLASGVQQPRVMVCAARSPDLLAALLAVIQLGAAYIPADSSTPADRCISILQDSGAAAVLADASTWQNCFVAKACTTKWIEIGQPGANTPVFTSSDVDSVCDVLRRSGRTNCHPSRVHNIIYTSGTTGKPKGVSVTECSITNVLRDWSTRSRLKAGEVVLAQTSISFDPHSAHYFAPLMYGACVLLTPDDIVRDGAALARLLDRCSIADSTPSGWQLIVASGWRGNPKLRAISGGEALRPELAEKLLPLVDSLQVRHNHTHFLSALQPHEALFFYVM